MLWPPFKLLQRLSIDSKLPVNQRQAVEKVLYAQPADLKRCNRGQIEIDLFAHTLLKTLGTMFKVVASVEILMNKIKITLQIYFEE